jgi:hypothetical protein
MLQSSLGGMVGMSLGKAEVKAAAGLAGEDPADLSVSTEMEL